MASNVEQQVEGTGLELVDYTVKPHLFSGFRAHQKIIKPLLVKYAFTFTDTWAIDANIIKEQIDQPVAITSPARTFFDNLASLQVGLVLNEHKHEDVLPDNPYVYVFFRMPICNVKNGITFKVQVDCLELKDKDPNYVSQTFQWLFEKDNLTTPLLPLFSRQALKQQSRASIGNKISIYFEGILLLPEGINEPDCYHSNVEADYVTPQLHFYPMRKRKSDESMNASEENTDVEITLEDDSKVKLKAHRIMLPNLLRSKVIDGKLKLSGISSKNLLFLMRYIYYRLLPATGIFDQDLLDIAASWEMHHYVQLCEQLRRAHVIRTLAKRMVIQSMGDSAHEQIAQFIGLNDANELRNKLIEFKEKYQFDPPTSVAYKKFFFFKAATEMPPSTNESSIPMTKNPYFTSSWESSVTKPTLPTTPAGDAPPAVSSARKRHLDTSAGPSKVDSSVGVVAADVSSVEQEKATESRSDQVTAIPVKETVAGALSSEQKAVNVAATTAEGVKSILEELKMVDPSSETEDYDSDHSNDSLEESKPLTDDPKTFSSSGFTCVSPRYSWLDSSLNLSPLEGAATEEKAPAAQATTSKK